MEPDQLRDSPGSAAAGAETHDQIPVVGVGASAGGLDAFTRLLKALPADTACAFVLVQHLDAKHPSSLSEILGRATDMPVADASDGTPVEPDRVYVIPPNTELTIAGGVLRLGPRPPQASHQPIDQFLKSLAADRGSRAIGVILSGTGSDGAIGIQAIAGAGGVTFAQDVASAEFPGMPSAAAAGGVDYVLAPEQIGVEIARLVRNPHYADTHQPETAPGEDDEAGLRAICDLMHKATGIDFARYRESTVSRRVRRRVALRNLATLGDYVRLLTDDEEERIALQQDLLIEVTSFFREPESFEALKRLVFPALVGQAKSAPIRIWVPGCASGAEAYSILIALQEFQDEQGTSVPVQVFASDVKESAIQRARLGVYPATIAAELSPGRLRTFFTKTDDGYQVTRSLRERCIFSRHDLLDDPPFSRLDLISCRNVLIYIEGAQEKIFPLFHYALLEHGFLMLGRAETVHADDLFTAVEPRHRIYTKRPVARPPHAFRARAELVRRGTAGDSAPEPPADRREALEISRKADRVLLSRFSPAGVLVDENLNVLETRGQTAPFLTLPAGKVSFKLLKLIPDTALYLEVETLLQQAAATGEPARRERVLYESGGRIAEVNIEATPLGGRQRATLILFETAAPAAAERPPDGASDSDRETDARDELIAGLRRSLDQARQRLVGMVEEHEASEEESQRVAEDALSANEELQSLTEELETAKEELQSTNEELITVNRDLEARNVALTTARDFTRAIVETVRVPLVVLDRALNVRHVNTSFVKAFEVPAGEVEGQALAALGGGAWNIPDLRVRLEPLLAAGASFDGLEVEREFPGVGRRCLVLSGNRLDAVDMILLTVEDVTAHRDIEKALRASEEQRRQAEKMEAVGRLAGGIAHDFNNLLTVVIGYCGLLAESVGSDAESGLHVEEIRRAALRAAELTDRLLAFSRRKILQPRTFDLNSVVVEFERMLRRLLTEEIAIKVRCAPNLWPVRADPGEIGRVVMNLSLNARDAMPAGGTLSIATGNVTLTAEQAAERGLEPGRYIRLVVGDTGTGMDPEQQEHLFEPFFTTKDISKGAGLGLSTVFGIVQQSGGAIWCLSEKGVGTEFFILLPAAKRIPEAVDHSTGGLAHAPKGASQVILLVEDEDGVRRLTRRILEATGYVVLEADDGPAAMDILEARQEPIDLLLSDVVLPNLGGRALAERAMAMRPGLKVLLVSGYAGDEILSEDLGHGMSFLAKPFAAAELSYRVAELLGTRPDGPQGG